MNLGLVSWIFWFSWMAAGIAYEIPAVLLEKRTGDLPLTRIVRDHLMKHNKVIRIGVITFLVWLLYHFAKPFVGL